MQKNETHPVGDSPLHLFTTAATVIHDRRYLASSVFIHDAGFLGKKLTTA